MNQLMLAFGLLVALMLVSCSKSPEELRKDFFKECDKPFHKKYSTNIELLTRTITIRKVTKLMEKGEGVFGTLITQPLLRRYHGFDFQMKEGDVLYQVTIGDEPEAPIEFACAAIYSNGDLRKIAHTYDIKDFDFF